MDIKEKVELVIKQFDLQGEIIGKSTLEKGHINDTFCIEYRLDNNIIKRYILQRINTNIFKNVDELMENVFNVTSHLKKKILENSGDVERETLSIIKTRDGKNYYKSDEGDYWRVYNFVEDTITYDLVENVQDFYESAVAFGNFQMLLSDFPANTLYETIPNFHNTVDRLDKLKEAIKNDVVGRVKDVKDEIDFVLDREKDCHIICDLLNKNEIPLRVTHNDTKLNNILIDTKTKKAICVIDLDTVMPGTVLNDFGDSIRFGASTALEDEKDLSKVECSMELFEAYTKGFIEGTKGKLTDKEKEMLPMGSKLMTLECGIRFLTDYLQGDTYFKISREGHNLDRARTQFKLVLDMENKWQQMIDITKKYS
ncbi:aminoglycoside phosphotransferase family protein [uncultured Tyzzerella sp.]|uniref:phosphotransferase enzyme family protein n=1 Tax=uncultured Tyzzerella sp. TaxID=2321398 RepID=UPI002942C398|nr:aminoglycoside phosphotransferase family protein [uncultured Tyzzerella sp.]